MEEEYALTLQRLQEENDKLRSLNRIELEKRQESSMEINRLQQEIEQLRSSHEEFETHQASMQRSLENLHHQIQVFERHVKQITSSDQEKQYNCNKKIKLSSKDQQMENAKSSLVQELQNTNAVYSCLELDNTSLRKILDEANNQLSTSEQLIMNLKNRLEGNESHEDAFPINSLPDEVILEIFGYLEQNELGQIAQVCRRWYVLSRCPVLWKKVDVKLSLPSKRSLTTITKSFINRLPSCVTSISLAFGYFDGKLDFMECCLKLQEKCPHLEELVLFFGEFSVSFSSVIDLCTQFLQDVKKLTFFHCRFTDCRLTDEFGSISKIEILGVFNCKSDILPYFLNKPEFSRMPCLKELYLDKSHISDSWFDNESSFLNQLHVLGLGYTHVNSKTFLTIQNCGHNLKELCFMGINVQDHHLNFNKLVFPQLKTICLKDCLWVTCEGIVSLIQSCQTLKNIYVDPDVAESFAAHPVVVANSLKSGIITTSYCNHDHFAIDLYS